MLLASLVMDVVELLKLHPLTIIHAASYITRKGYSTELYLQQIRALCMPKLTYQKNHPSNVLQRTCQGLEIVGAYGQCQTRIGDYVSTEISPWGQFCGGQLRGCESLV